MLQILEGAAVIAAMSLYLIPSIEADAREHADAFAITMVNILLGWTIVGWFAARAWAHRAEDTQPLLRTAQRIRSAVGRVTSQKIVDHVKLRAALECRDLTRRHVATGPCA
ncbi:superinfection immunity protein [Paraburkholderia kururiensis]|uniref:superinfection immunity protein n=2 Tax=Paraburkholderia TaxID=1822464 RepID=UPI003B811FD5